MNEFFVSSKSRTLAVKWIKLCRLHGADSLQANDFFNEHSGTHADFKEFVLRTRPLVSTEAEPLSDEVKYKYAEALVDIIREGHFAGLRLPSESEAFDSRLN